MTELANISETKLETKILQSLFDLLDREKIDYCIVNNYEHLPYIIPSDVDIAIDPLFFGDIDIIVWKVSQEHKVKIVQKIWHGYQKCAYILSPITIDERFRLQLDFFTDFSARGYPCLITHEKLLGDRRSFKGFFIPAIGVEAVMLFMRRVIKNDMKISHVARLKTLYAINPAIIEKTMIELIDRKAWLITMILMETGDIGEFNKHIKSLRRILKARMLKGISFVYLVKYSFSQLKRAIYRLRYPVGLCIIFLGPDGCGKSTIANLVLERVSGSFHGHHIKYWRPDLLPMFGRLKFWNPPEAITTNPDPHGHPKQNKLKSLIRFFYYLADYIIGYTFKVYWAKVRKQIIIFDRYYYDYLVDLHRYSFNVPAWLPKLLLPLVPSPDIIVYLDAEPEVLARRKQELPMAELKRQVGEYRKLISELPNSHKIISDVPIETVVKKIATVILEIKSKQTERTIGNNLKKELVR